MHITERIAAAAHLAEFYGAKPDPRSQRLARRYLARARFLSRRLVVSHG